MTGTTFNTGVGTSKRYSGNTDTSNNYEYRTQTKVVHRTAVIHCIGSEADNAERTTDFTLPTTAIVKEVYLNVITLDTGETVNVGTEGTSNDPNGYLALASLAAVGIVKPLVAITTGSNEVYMASTTYGALLANFTAGADVATDVGTFVRKDDITAGGDPVSYTCSSGTNTAVFDIIIEYDEIVNEQ